MKTRQGHIIGIDTVNDQYFLAKKALGIIWFTGVICIAIISIFFINTSSTVPKNDTIKSGNANTDISSIDQLLLTSEESLLEDKKSFVNGALRFQWRNQVPDLNQENNRTILYDNILKKKLQRLPRTLVSDFSVKPVPK
ncbi:MAG: hypothetical protein WBC06_12120 [Chitinophagaceae bacterium]